MTEEEHCERESARFWRYVTATGYDRQDVKVLLLRERAALRAERDALAALRPEVLAFARAMEAKLKENDHKGGWHDDTPQALLARLYEEVDELKATLHPIRRRDDALILREAADVANFALMIADVCGALPLASLPSDTGEPHTKEKP